MDEILKKISAYDLLNTLIPGAALVFFLRVFGYLDFKAEDVLFLVVLAYILGVVASRVGSLILEPIALRFDWFEHDYTGFVEAQKEDDRLLTLTTIANMYRTLAGLMTVLAVLALGSLVPEVFRLWLYTGYGVSAFLLFLCGWVKQERYVHRRLDICRKEANDNH